MKSNLNQKFKIRLILPFLILPFVTLGFWALGGGKGNRNQKPATEGIDTHIPKAHLKNEHWEDKLSFYEQAERDSQKQGESKSESLSFLENSPTKWIHPNFKGGNSSAAGEENIFREIDRLHKVLLGSSRLPPPAAYPSVHSGQIQAETMNQMEKKMLPLPGDSLPDPQMTQIDLMLDKILKIEHLSGRQDPAVAAIGIPHANGDSGAGIPGETPTSQAGTEGSVKLKTDQESQNDEGNSFFTDSDSDKVRYGGHPTLRAEVYGTQIIESGKVIKMRLLNSLQIQGQLIPGNCIISGLTTLSGNRLMVQVRAIPYENEIYPVSLQAYDLDGLQGIDIPEIEGRTELKQSGGDAFTNIPASAPALTLGAQAAEAGIHATKSLLSHKIRQIRVTVKSGYRLLLAGKISQP